MEEEEEEEGTDDKEEGDGRKGGGEAFTGTFLEEDEVGTVTTGAARATSFGGSTAF